MTKDKKVLWSISILIFAVLFAALFIGVKSSKILTACLLVPLTALTCILIKKRSSLSINKKEVLLLSSVLAVIFAVLTQMTGISFGFYKNPYFVSSNIFLTVILPTVAIIITTEMIRAVMLAQKDHLASVSAFLSCVLAEVLTFSNISGIKNMNLFMDMIGMTLFPAAIANIYYHYVSRRFGMLPNIAFRLVTSLYTCFLPQVTAIPDALFACIKIFLPIVILALVSALFEKRKKNAVQKGKKLSAVGMVVAMLIVISVAMLISCRFRFGALVVATESMTGEINKGDMIIYERYEDQEIKEGQVIVFTVNDRKTIHRVVEIKNIGGETRYYTKGDANDDRDGGYRVDEDIVGLTDLKVAFVGYPTLWLRELLSGS
ncbi:MAG: signal peptidase I [Clostridia bacterium]|nr:signal peptidase I [Clostridia bacterium]